MAKPSRQIKRVYRNEAGVPFSVTVTAKTVHIYAPGCTLSTEQFAAILADIQDAWQVLNTTR